MNNDLKRHAVKYVRDRAKRGYSRDSKCYICESTEGLDFHHYNSVTQLLDRWLKEQGIEIKSADDIILVRDEFIALHEKELYQDAVTLCHKHHEALHRLYGQKPLLSTALKQPVWVEKQRQKFIEKNGTN